MIEQERQLPSMTECTLSYASVAESADMVHLFDRRARTLSKLLRVVVAIPDDRNSGRATPNRNSGWLPPIPDW